MSSQDIGVVAQTTSGTPPGDNASTLSSMQPQWRASRTHSHNYDTRPRRPPERPLNEPGYTRSESRQRREGEEKSAGSEYAGGPPPAHSASGPAAGTAQHGPHGKLHRRHRLVMRCKRTRLSKSKPLAMPAGQLQTPADHPPRQANAGIWGPRAVKLCQVLNRRAPRPLLA